LVMGPGCGTAMLGGIGLGFANVVAPGRVGIVAAAGTGAQEAACLVEAAGAGITQIIGVGGRDLSSDIGGIMYRQGIRMLAADDDTDILLLVSKPPSPAVVQTLGEVVPADKRVVAAFVGWEGGEAPFEVHATIDEAVRAAVGGAEPDLTEAEAAVAAARPRTSGRALTGLYSGGSLAHEAVTILEPVLGPVGGNAGHGDASSPHAILDLGEEEYTQGRPHPMVDLDLRVSMIADLAHDGTTGCLLLDVVLGHGSHPNPGVELAAALAPLTATGVVIASVCGTAGDPQDLLRQEKALQEAGVVVAPSNAAAARLALMAVA
jgi:FdrA protein